jgi:pimeloyl-ACP methyl ester carboxylesterase
VALRRPPEDADPVDWAVEQVRAVEASARIYFPLGDTRLARRLPRITAPTLLLWGDADRVLPLAYADAFAAHIRAGKELRVIEGAGHLAELDRPTETAQAVSAWLGPHA